MITKLKHSFDIIEMKPCMILCRGGRPCPPNIIRYFNYTSTIIINCNYLYNITKILQKCNKNLINNQKSLKALGEYTHTHTHTHTHYLPFTKGFFFVSMLLGEF